MLFWVLFVSMRQDLRLHLMLVRKVNLAARCESLRQQLRAEQRDLAVRADLGRIAQPVERRGLRAPEREQVLALVEEPQPVEREVPLPMALLEKLSGATDVHAAGGQEN